MKTYSIKEKPFVISGSPLFKKTGKIHRLTEEIRNEIPSLDFLGRRCPGARVGFITDASEFTVTIHFATLNFDIGMSIYACHSAHVMVGKRSESKLVATVYPPNYTTKTFSNKVIKSDSLEEVTIWLPRNEEIIDVEITFPDNAVILPPTPYKHGPALYYGSSITEGGCCCNITNAYNALLCRYFDLDYYNFGFSGAAMGEEIMAEYIASLNPEIFIYDYDHNAPTKEHLEKTHKPFFDKFRSKRPYTPVVMLTMPNFDFHEEGNIRREIIKETYKEALKSGDKNVYFVDGETFFGEKDRELCTIDMIHPNDLGFYRMAQAIKPVIKNILEKKEHTL
ncbi:MAG: hypothetical protein E7388_00485 [Ruminococcaceae bacterium]|nr:hypothetical protein [Oscillospiraceae bacterium]